MLKVIKSVFLAFVLTNVFSCGHKSHEDNEIRETYPIVPNISFFIQNIYPHDTTAFTQGLEYFNGLIYEGTGDYKNSSVRIVDLKSGKVKEKNLMGTTQLFGEGITIFNDTIYQLTWKNNIVFLYDVKNIHKSIRTFFWQKEGWGITNDGTNLIISDGSSVIYFVDPKTFRIVRSIQVLNANEPIDKINELDFIHNSIYANVFEKNIILKINPSTGKVTGIINCDELIKENNLEFTREPEKVLNGIAWDSLNSRMFITGKLWPMLFEIKINE